MINFIVCEDNKSVRKINENIIAKVTMPYDFNYRVHLFSKYDSKLNSIINSSDGIKIYLLDIELPGKSGIEIARNIRKKDWESIIIILTSHNELEFQVLKQNLLILKFISKFDDYENNLKKILKLILSKLNNEKNITFKSNKELHQMKISDILYIYKDTTSEKTMVVTEEDEYPVRETLSNFASKLGNSFCQTHRACYVNIDKIKHVDYTERIIYFDNDRKIYYLSRNYKKELKEKIKK